MLAGLTISGRILPEASVFSMVSCRPKDWLSCSAARRSGHGMHTAALGILLGTGQPHRRELLTAERDAATRNSERTI